jgi:3-hydroxybutyryl-CoA dehydratase
MALKRVSFKAGAKMPELRRQVTQERVNLYAGASGDFNPIHIDPEFARAAQLGGTIAHGMLILAYLSEFMTNSFKLDWLTDGNLSVRFKVPARPGDTITVSGEITKIQPEGEFALIYCDVLCQNQRGESVIIGETKVRVKDDENSR